MKNIVSILRSIRIRHIIAIAPLIFLMLGSSAVSMASAQTTIGPDNPNLPAVSGVAYGVQYGAATTLTPLTPACIMYITLMYPENLTGVIQTNVPAMGNEHGLIDSCASPGFAEINEVSTMTNVTIAGRTGTLVLAADTNIPAFLSTGVVFSSVFTVVGSSGGLAGLTGQGIQVGSATSTGSSLVYWFQFQFNNTVSVINVSTANSTAKPITGYYTTLWQNGKQIASCFSSCELAVNNGQRYQVAVSDYGTEHFAHWQDGSTTRFYTVNVPSTSTTIPVTATFKP